MTTTMSVMIGIERWILFMIAVSICILLSKAVALYRLSGNRVITNTLVESETDATANSLIYPNGQRSWFRSNDYYNMNPKPMEESLALYHRRITDRYRWRP